MACSSCQKSAAARAGNNVGNAIILGDWTDEVWRVKAIQPIGGIPIDAVKYVRGATVLELVDEGSFELLSTISNMPGRNRNKSPKKLWYVGNVGYTSYAAAKVRSEQVGIPPQERRIPS